MDCQNKAYNGVACIQQREVEQIESMKVWSKKEKDVFDNKVPVSALKFNKFNKMTHSKKDSSSWTLRF